MAEEFDAVAVRKEAMALGKELELTGKELTKFIFETVEDAKAAEKSNLKRLEIEQKRLEKDLEQKRLEKEAEQKRLDREAETERLKLKLEHEREMENIKVKKEPSDSNQVYASMFGGFSPQIKLPKFEEEKDNFDAYIARFERMAESQKWPKEQWALGLTTLLSGRALDTVQRMDSGEMLDYTKVKETLMNKFRLTTEGFRYKFRNTKPEKDDSPEQFSAKIGNLLNRWIELSHIEKTFEGLYDLIKREQFLNCCNSDMRAFIKEKECKNMHDVVKWSKTYVSAHGLRAFTQVDRTPHKGGKWENKGIKQANGNSGQKSGNIIGQTVRKVDSKNFERNAIPFSRSSESRTTFRGVKCYDCGGSHFARDCPNRRKTQVSQGMMLQSDNVSTNPMKPPVNGEGSWYLWVPKSKSLLNEKNEGKTDSSEQTENAAACFQISSLIEGEPNEGISENQLPKLGMAYDSMDVTKQRMPVVSGRLMPENKPVSVLRDSGCSTCVVRANLVKPNQLTGETQSVKLIDGTIRNFPVARINVDSPYITRQVEALCIPESLSDVVIRNVEGAREPRNPNFDWKPQEVEIKNDDGIQQDRVELVSENSEQLEMNNEMEVESVQDISTGGAVETRAQAVKRMRGMKELKVPSTISEVKPEELALAQKEDKSIDHLWKKASNNCDDQSKYIFVVENGWLFRQVRESSQHDGKNSKVLVVPEKYRDRVMKMAHESIVSGHLGINNTINKIQSQFYWPGLNGDVTRFCRSCDICQKTIDKGRITKVPLGRMPVMEVPFQRIAIDLIGPLNPPTERGHRYILTIVDFATRYPEAIPLKSITTIEVAEALFNTYTRVGFPSEVLSDLGTQFVSDLMKEVSRLMSIKQIHCSRYHAMNNGMCEKQNGLIKKILKRMCAEKPNQWDRYLPAVLFALREIPNSSLGFSPFELLYGRQVRGPMSIIRELWTNQHIEPEVKDEYQYVVDLRERLESTWELARTTLSQMSQKYKKYYDLKARPRKLKVGDKVLVLLPEDQNKLLLRWKGPYKVVEKKYDNDYVIDMDGVRKTFHINLLKFYFERGEEMVGCFELVTDSLGALEEINEVENRVLENTELDEITEFSVVSMPSTLQKKFVQQVKVNPELDDIRKDQIWKLLYQYQDVFTDVPKKTSIMKCKIQLNTDEPIRSKPYHVPQAMKETIKNEVDEMLKLGVIERSESSYGHPIVMVKKPDGSNRFCIDFRKMNQVTVFDPEPIPNPQDIFASLTGSKYFTKFDLTKGYWQLALEDKDKEKTAFLTPEGKFQFKYMPFGLVTAGAQFTKLMRIVLKGISNVVSFIDDTLIFHKDWKSHVETVELVLARLREVNLGVRPKKCAVAFNSVEFLGHIVGNDQIKTNPKLIQKIEDASRPTTKKQVRALLGLTGFYREYIPHYSDVVLHLTMLTGKGMPDKVKWGEDQETAFQKLKQCLSQPPVLRLPDFNRLFILKVDASETGLGAALMQNFDGGEFPVAYASRKLLPRERNYATIEKECLAIIWAVKKFEFYLYGRVFEIHTDHQPLTFLNTKKMVNKRVMRWALALQEFRFRLVSIKGKDSLVADFLSRGGHP